MRLLRLALILLAATIGCGRGSTQADLHAVPGQNVLLITIDTLRADALSCYGGPAATPALDRLASDGVRFDFAHAHAVVTLTSHASILTGQYPFQHGLRDNSGYRLPSTARTVATMLKGAGYATAAFVGAFPLHSRFGLNRGFDVYDDRFGETVAPTEFVMPERPAQAVVGLAREWMAARRSDRWFAWIHLFDPHAPYRPPPPFDVRYSARPYFGEVAAVDAALAPLLDDVRGASRPTLVVVTGDHGEALGDHGEQSHGLFAYEATLRIPLIVAALSASGSAANRQPGEVSTVSARHVDILPTMLEAAGQSIPADLPGRSLLPAAERQNGSTPRPVYFEAMGGMLNRGWAPLAGVLVDRDKFIDLPIAERYDLGADAAEQSNLAGRSSDRDRTLAAILRGFNAPLPGVPSPNRPKRPSDCARSATSRGMHRGKRRTRRPTIRSASWTSTPPCIARSRPTAPDAWTRRSRRIARSWIGGPTWRWRTGTLPFSNGSEAISTRRSTRCSARSRRASRSRRWSRSSAAISPIEDRSPRASA